VCILNRARQADGGADGKAVFYGRPGCRCMQTTVVYTY
jgi:hypothetical protein